MARGIFMKIFKRFAAVLMILAMGALAACANAPRETETAPAEQTAIEADSILCFGGDEGSAKLVQYFAEGKAPEEATFLYDQMGSNPEITVTDPEQIRELYRLLSLVTVAGETDMSVTDCYHYIQFKLAEDLYVHYSFEGSEIWRLEEKSYTIENNNKLFSFMQELTEEYGS